MSTLAALPLVYPRVPLAQVHAPRKLRLIWCGIPSDAPGINERARKHWPEMFAPHGFIEVEEAARRLGLKGTALSVPDSTVRDRVVRAVRSAGADLVDLLISDQQMHPTTIERLTNFGIATSCSYAGSVKSGALLAYEVVGTEEIAVALAARILRGEPVATLPAQQAQQFRLALNLRTARALGITIPPAVMLRTQDVVE